MLIQDTKPVTHAVRAAATSHLTARELRLLTGRFDNADPVTLTVIANEWGVTRQRVQQVERQTLDVFRHAVARYGVTHLVNQLGDVLDIAELAASDPWATWSTTPSGAGNLTVADIILATAGYRNENGWYAKRGALNNRIAETRAATKQPTPVETVAPFLTTVDAKTRWATRCGLTTLPGGVVSASPTRADIIEAHLAAMTGPATLAEIAERTGMSRQNVTSAILDDDRFTRVGPATWTLTTVNVTPYRGVVDEIGDVIDKAGGTAPVTLIVDTVAERFGVKPATVRFYVTRNPAFHAVDGHVTRAGAHHQPVRTARPRKDVYKAPNGWALLRVVTDDHVRGIGVTIPDTFAAALNLHPTLNPETDLGGFTAMWKSNQARVRTIREWLRTHDVHPGDVIAFDIRDGAGTIRHIPTGVTLTDALNIPDSGHIPAAVGLQPGTSEADIITHLAGRGDKALLTVTGVVHARTNTPTAGTRTLVEHGN